MSVKFKNTKDMIILSLFSAIIVAMTFIPYVGYITYGAVSITTIHVPVIIAAILLGPINGLIIGTVWGITCLLKALTLPSVEGLIFLNPLISLVPRMIVGLFVGSLSMILAKLIKHKIIRCSIIAALGSLCNTVLVISAIGLFGGTSIIPIKDTIGTIFKVLISLNGVVEIILAILVVPAIVISLEKARGGILNER